MSAKYFYVLITLCLIIGIGWIGFQKLESHTDITVGSVCLIKNVSGQPCPSCGSTRAVLAILDGDLIGAIDLNPFGYLIVIFLIILPIGLVIDLVTNKKRLYRAYLKTEQIVQNKVVAVPLLFIVFANWIWNIIKGL